jgi:glucoamylase
VDINNPEPNEDPNCGTLAINNRHPGERSEFSAREVVDAGFLELVRYGIRPANDTLIENSLRVVDAGLKVVTPFGPCWYRYNNDGYGPRPDGAFRALGKGQTAAVADRRTGSLSVGGGPGC